MYKQGLISENMFQLTIPYDDDDGFDGILGELILGGSSELARMIPVLNSTMDLFEEQRAGWVVDASEVRLGDGGLLRYTMEQGLALV
jgi:hypothetical protein